MTTPTPSLCNFVKCITDDGQELPMMRCPNCKKPRIVGYRCDGCDLAAAQEALVSVKSHAEALTEFRDYFTDRCEGLFFQFGMEVIDLYNATHGYEACRIEPDRAAHPKDAP